MEDIINTEVIDNAEVFDVINDEPETNSNDKLIKAAVIVGSIATAGVVVLAIKSRRKIEEWQINRLRKKGYVIYKEEELEDYVEEDAENEEDAE